MNKPKKSNEMPATQGMLYEVRDELKSEVTSVRLEMKYGFSELASKIESLTSKIEGHDAKFEEQNAKIHRMLTLYEEQENRNKYVLDGYASINSRLEKLEKSV